MRVLLYCILIFMCITNCQENDLATVQEIINPKDNETEIADSIELIYKENGYPRAIIKANKLKRYTKSQSKLEFSDGIEVRFFEQQELVSVMTAKYALNDDMEQTFVAKDSVRMENNKNEILNTQELIWNIRNKKIFANNGLKIRTQDDIIYGKGMIADEDFANYTIKKVTGIVNVDDDNGFK